MVKRQEKRNQRLIRFSHNPRPLVRQGYRRVPAVVCGLPCTRRMLTSGSKTFASILLHTRPGIRLRAAVLTLVVEPVHASDWSREAYGRLFRARRACCNQNACINDLVFRTCCFAPILTTSLFSALLPARISLSFLLLRDSRVTRFPLLIRSHFLL